LTLTQAPIPIGCVVPQDRIVQFSIVASAEVRQIAPVELKAPWFDSRMHPVIVGAPEVAWITGMPP
jgi:hypothetical protein